MSIYRYSRELYLPSSEEKDGFGLLHELFKLDSVGCETPTVSGNKDKMGSEVLDDGLPINKLVEHLPWKNLANQMKLDVVTDSEKIGNYTTLVLNGKYASVIYPMSTIVSI